MKRTFIALDIPCNQNMQLCINELSSELKNENIRWVHENRFHLTLKFLGDTEEKLLPDINSILDHIASNCPPFDLVIKKVGIFKNFHNPRIIWIGIEKNEVLIHLKNELEDQIKKFGFLKDETVFSPHLTVGRIKYLQNKESLRFLVGKYNDEQFDIITANEVIFYESKLSSHGAEYSALGKFKLAGTQS